MPATSPPSYRPSPSFRVFLREPWISSASRQQMIWMAIIVGAIVFLVTVAAQLLFEYQDWPTAIILWSSDVLASVLAGLLSLRLMQHARERHQAMQQRLRVIAELNHEIRNALDLIQMSAYMTHDPETIQYIGNAVERIERSLEETLEGRSGQPLQQDKKANGTSA